MWCKFLLQHLWSPSGTHDWYPIALLICWALLQLFNGNNLGHLQVKTQLEQGEFHDSAPLLHSTLQGDTVPVLPVPNTYQHAQENTGDLQLIAL